MRVFHCNCGQPVFFDSEWCLACGSRLGFDVQRMDMVSIVESSDGYWRSTEGKAYQLCENTVEFDLCNWLRPANQSNVLCRGCQFNRTIPNQSLPDNRRRWHRLEEAKKRLFYTLMQFGLPLNTGWADPKDGLLFDFIEDGRSQPAYAETFVHTGFGGGIITINALEADDAAREAQREQMNERYRTVLGHMRHESGHYYWQWLVRDEALTGRFRELFGDDRWDYGAALERYYENGPVAGWSESFISKYASAHPLEDWAESWGHYLHIYDAMDTAAAHGLLHGAAPGRMTISERIQAWRKLSVSLNELNRSIGRVDAYPFVLNSAVESKLFFVDEFMHHLQTVHQETAVQ